MKNTNHGQAVIEYIFIIAFIGGLGVAIVRGYSNFLKVSRGLIAYHLTQHLNVGLCDRNCNHQSFSNRNQ